MKQYALSILLMVFILIAPVAAVGLPWDANTTSLHHFDLINTNNDNGDNTTLDQTNTHWWSSGSPSFYYSGCKFNNCIRLFSSDDSGYYIVNPQDPNVYVPTEYMFDKNGNWTVEGWINLTVAPAANNNGTLISWMGVGDKNRKTFNGTNVYVNSARNVVLTTPGSYTGTPYITSSTALTLGTWTNFAVVKNGTSMKMYLNGVQNGTASTATTYNWSPGYSDDWLIADPNALVYTRPSIGANIWMTAYSTAPDGYVDEFRISNIPRYPANYTVATTEFFNPLNKTTLFTDLTGTYNVGTVQTATLSASNISYTDIMTMNIGSIVNPLQASIARIEPYPSLPTGWFVSSNYTIVSEGTARLDFTTVGASPITSKTPIGTALVSIDSDSSFTLGSFKRNDFYNQIDNTTFYINGSAPTAYSISPSGYLTYQYPASPTIIDASNSSLSWLYDFSEITNRNVGEKFNVTMSAGEIYDVTGTKSSLKFNKSMFQVSNIYGVEPYYDIDYTINNVDGYVNFTALYPQYGGKTASLGSCTMSDPIWCGFERYLSIEMYPTYYASLPSAPAGSNTIWLDTGNYTAGNPFRNSNGYTYSEVYGLSIPFGSPTVSDIPLSTTVRLININTGSKIDGAAVVSYDARGASPASPTNVVGGSMVLTHKGGTFNVTAVADGFFSSTQTFTVGTSGTTIDVILTPLSGPSQNVWWTPHTVKVTIMDIYGQRLPDVTVAGYYNQSSMPVEWVKDLYGVRSSPAADIVNPALALTGETGGDGSITFTMLGSIKYDFYLTSVSRGLTNYHVQAFPSDYALNLYVPLPGVSLPSTISTNYTGLNMTRAYIVNTNTTFWNMCIDYQDVSGTTTSVTNTWKYAGNGTIAQQNTFVPTTALVTQCLQVPHVRGVQYWWWTNATRTI